MDHRYKEQVGAWSNCSRSNTYIQCCLTPTVNTSNTEQARTRISNVYTNTNHTNFHISIHNTVSFLYIKTHIDQALTSRDINNTHTLLTDGIRSICQGSMVAAASWSRDMDELLSLSLLKTNMVRPVALISFYAFFYYSKYLKKAQNMISYHQWPVKKGGITLMLIYLCSVNGFHHSAAFKFSLFIQYHAVLISRLLFILHGVEALAIIIKYLIYQSSTTDWN